MSEVRRGLRLRIAASPQTDLVGRTIGFEEGAVTIGRDPRCTITLSDDIVSREHARVEPGTQGLQLTDLDSGNGVWLGDERVAEATLTQGSRFRIGYTVIECVGDETPEKSATGDTLGSEQDDATAIFREAVREEPEFFVHVLSADEAAGSTVVEVSGKSAIIGRTPECTVTVGDLGVSRKHARVEAHASGFRVTDLGSSNGTWIGDQRIDKPTFLASGQSFRVGETVVIECYLPGHDPAEAAAGPVAADPADSADQPPVPSAVAPRPDAAAAEDDGVPEIERSVVMPTSALHLERTRKFEEEGELVEVIPTEPFLLDDAGLLWYVVKGEIDIFTVVVEGGQATGARTHFLGVLPGQCFFGFDLQSYGMGSGFLAVGKPGTKLRKIPMSRLREIAEDEERGEAVATLIDTWVEGLSKRLTQDIVRPATELEMLEPDSRIELSLAQRASTEKGVAWVDVWSGSLLFIDMATPVFSGRRALFPVTNESWVQPVSDEFGDLSLQPRSTLDSVADPSLWLGLDAFHEALCECEFINKKLSVVDEYIRLQDKARHSEAAERAAYDAIGSVLRTEAATPSEFLRLGGAEPVLEACNLVGEAMGMTVKDHPEAADRLTYEDHVAAIAAASGFRTRVVALRGEWWKGDHGPILGQLEDAHAPVALLPTSARSYDCVNPRTGVRKEVDEDLAANLLAFGYAFYRPFPDGILAVPDIMRFGTRGMGTEFRMVVLMGIIVGVLGTATPYFTGRIFDSAIPQADEGLLLGFGIALFGAALATSLFKITQAIATLRIQGKMEYSVQAALWDRLLNLPANFFRKYSAGDLAERVGGIDAIQSLISGAGVSAILGSFSGIFYVVLMLTYNTRLALLAIVLTIIYVSVTMFCNYLQLRHQRVEIRVRGHITGLVLNLITGVTKLRISGAEHHAFRLWAQQFAKQKKIGFDIGRIQNIVAVFSGVFPVVSSMAIFYFMVVAQLEAAETGETVLTTGDFIAFNSAYGLFLAAMMALGEASLSLLRVVPIWERLKPVITTPAEVDSTKVYPGRLRGQIVMSHVHFRYHEEGPWIMKDLSLEIEPGEFVAFVGGSGCGKSTLMRLMLGFEQPDMGSIYYDGQDLDSLDLRMLRQQLGVVLQVSRVLPTDVYRNIVGISSRSMEDAWAAAEAAGLADDIRSMPMQMHTYVSEGGGTLSGGQRQRLLIARAVVNRPKIIFLDEATSALDNRAQATVTESMDRMESTRIVIAHRLSTVMNADKICYLEGGRIAEMGRYNELMELDGLFAELARRQMA